MSLPAHWGPDWTWHALRVAPGRELTVMAVLRDDGRNQDEGDEDWLVFVPLKHVLVRPRRLAKRKVLTARAQYPGYVFCGFRPGVAPPWPRVLRFRAILGVVGRDGEPVPVYEPTMIAMLAGVRRPVNYVNHHRDRRGNRGHSKGQRTAEIISGPYENRIVRVVEPPDDDPHLFELMLHRP